MGLPGGLQVRVKSPESSVSTAVVPCWTLPICGVATKSLSVTMATGDDVAMTQPRIADALGIIEGQEVEFEIVEIGESVRAPVKILEGMDGDVSSHDFLPLGLQNKSVAAALEKKSLQSLEKCFLP